MRRKLASDQQARAKPDAASDCDNRNEKRNAFLPLELHITLDSSAQRSSVG
jgi:hypothetical protein